MSTMSTRSLVVISNEFGLEKAICPVVEANRNGFVVKGVIAKRANPVKGITSDLLDLDGRWATLTKPEVAELVELAAKNGLGRACRVISSIAGNSRGSGQTRQTIPGSCEGIYITLTGSPEAEKLAVQYGVNYTKVVGVGRDRAISVEMTNPIIVTLSAAAAALDLLQFPEMEKEGEQPASRFDSNNPSLQGLLAHFDQYGELPTRNAVTNSRMDPEMAAGIARQQAARAQQQPQNGWQQRQAAQGGYNGYSNRPAAGYIAPVNNTADYE